MIPLTDEETMSYENQEVCHICKKESCNDENQKSEIKLYKVRDIGIALENLEEHLIVFAI